jgi:hypothetical protein
MKMAYRNQDGRDYARVWTIYEMLHPKPEVGFNVV